MYHMIVEQTKKYRKRIRYDAEANAFIECEYDSIGYIRKVHLPYGWIKESGTPPQPHWDVILMSDDDFELGDTVAIKIIGIFIRNDGDHKFIAVEAGRNIEDYKQLSNNEKQDLQKLYPRINSGEGWFGKKRAIYVMNTCKKPL